MRKILPFAAAAALLIGCTTATRISVLDMPIPTETHVAPIDVTPYMEKYGDYDGVYLDYETTVEHSGDKDQTKQLFFGGAAGGWVYSYLHKSKKLVINPDASWLTTVELPYSKPDKLYMRVIAPDGSVQYFDANDLIEFKDSQGRKLYKFIYPNIQKGSIIDYGYDYTFTSGGYPPPLDESFDLQFSIPCVKLDVQYIYPNWWEITTKRLSEKKGVPLLFMPDSANHKTILDYHAIDVPALKLEPYCPSFMDLAMYLDLRVTHLEMMGVKWDAPANWNAVSENFRKYMIKKSGKEGDDVLNLVTSLTAKCTTDLEKLDAINDYIVTNIKRDAYADYDGDPHKILVHQKGNAFEITSLAEQMLAKANIKSQYLLVHDATDGFFDKLYVDLSQFSLPALRVMIDSVDYVLFPYYERLPINVIPRFAQGQTALVTPEEGPTSFWTVPVASKEHNTEDRVCDVTVDTTGTVSVREVRTLRGLDAYDMRDDMRNYSPEELRDSLRELVAYKGMSVTLDSFTVDHEKEYREPLAVTMYYSLENTMAFAGDDAILQTAGLLAPVAYIPPYDDISKRQNPVSVNFDSYLHRTLTISYPEGWNIVTPLSDIDYKNEFGEVKGSYLTTPGKLSVEQELSLNRATGSKEQIVDLVALIGTTPKTWVPSIVFRQAVAN